MSQLASHSEGFLYTNRKTRRPCKYPPQMIKDARVMRENGYFYSEIATALATLYRDEMNKIGIDSIPWITVRDWTNYYYRVSG